MSRHAGGRLTALLKLDVEQLRRQWPLPPQSNAGPVADGRIPSLGRQMRGRRLQRVAGAFRADRPHTSLMSVGRILSRFLGQGGACEEATSRRLSSRANPRGRSWASGGIRRAKGHSAGQSSQDNALDTSPKGMANRTSKANQPLALLLRCGPWPMLSSPATMPPSYARGWRQ
jgi:hypothetical protein